MGGDRYERGGSGERRGRRGAQQTGMSDADRQNMMCGVTEPKKRRKKKKGRRSGNCYFNPVDFTCGSRYYISGVRLAWRGDTVSADRREADAHTGGRACRGVRL